MGFLLFIVFIVAAILVSPWFLLGCVVQILVQAWATSGRRYY